MKKEFRKKSNVSKSFSDLNETVKIKGRRLSDKTTNKKMRSKKLSRTQR